MLTCFPQVHRFASGLWTANVGESPLATARGSLTAPLLDPKALLEKHHLHRPQIIHVLLLPKAVPFVGGVDGPDGSALLADLGGDLLGFADVLTVIQNESGERCGEFILERTAGILAARRSFDSNISRKLNARVANITGLPCL